MGAAALRIICLASVAMLTVGTGALGVVGPHPRLADLVDNTASDLGRYRCDAPADDPAGCEKVTDYSRFVYDRLNHQLLMFGGGHAATHRTDVDVFNFGTLAWGSAYASTRCSELRKENRGLQRGDWLSTGHPIARHTYDMLVMAESTERLLLLSWGAGDGGCAETSPPGEELYRVPGRIAAYDPVSRRWSYSAARNDAWKFNASAEYDPVSEMVIVMDDGGLWTYDPVKEVVSSRVRFSGDLRRAIGSSSNLIYFPPNQKMYLINDGGLVVEVTLNRRVFEWTRVAALSGITGDIPRLEETGFAYDSVNRIIGGGISNGVFHAFDPMTRRWIRQAMRVEAAGRAVGTQAFHALDYDPVDNVFIFLTDYASGYRTWAYRYAGSRDRVRAAAGSGQVAPR